MDAILTTLVPIFLIIALGAALQRGGFFPDGFVGTLNKLNFWVGLPAVIFVSLATADHGEGRPVVLLVALAVATLTMVLIGWLGARALGVPVAGRGTFVQAAFRGNWAFVGLPILLTLPGVPRTTAVLVMAPMMVLFNVLAVSALMMSRHGMSLAVLRPLVTEVARNPIIVASVAGGAFYATGWECPRMVELTLRPIGAMVVPLALVCIGAALMSLPLRGNLGTAVAAAAGKAFVAPLVGWAVARALGVSGEEMRVMLVYMAAPTAVMSHTMVRQLGGDEALAASTIVLSTLFSAAGLAGAVAFVSA